MKGLKVYSENNIEYLRININNHDESINVILEELLNLMAVEENIDKNTISWNEAKNKLADLIKN